MILLLYAVTAAALLAMKECLCHADSRDTQLANTAFLSVFVSAGHHRVKVLYKPESFVTGRAITVATIAAIAIAALLRKLRQLLLQ